MFHNNLKINILQNVLIFRNNEYSELKESYGR